MWIVFQVVINWIKWLDYRLNICKNTGYHWLSAASLHCIKFRIRCWSSFKSVLYSSRHWITVISYTSTCSHFSAFDSSSPIFSVLSLAKTYGMVSSFFFFLFLWRGNVPFVCLRWKWSEMHLGYCQGPRTFSGFDTRNRYYHYNGIL